tara:strand:+ start:9031 stop:12750 length:3720 start_codon:yes stop_codon:yes gene_type:complete
MEYEYQNCSTILLDAEYVIINLNPDGSIGAFVDYSSDPNTTDFQPIAMGQACCEVYLPQRQEAEQYSGVTFTWDGNFQQCKWLESVDCNNRPPFSVVLNPNGNSGSLFQVEEGETCVLDVQFDYMFKFNCQNLLDVQLSGATPELLQLYEDLDSQLNTCASIQYQIDAWSANTFNYVIPYIEPNTTEVAEYFCLTEIGVALAQIFVTTEQSPEVWDAYLASGDPYLLLISGNDATTNLGLYIGAQQAFDGTEAIYYEICEDGEGRIFETTDWLNQLNDLNVQLEDCQVLVDGIQNHIDALLAAEVGNCLYVIDAFEDLSVEMAIEIQNSTTPQIVTTPYSEEIYNAGSGNLFSYLVRNIKNPLYIEGYNGVTCSNDTCDELAKILTQQLINEGVTDEVLTGSTYFNQYAQLLELTGDNPFSVNWLTYSNTITDPAVISAITNQNINLSIRVVDGCVDFSILIDRITLNKVCTRVINEDIFVGTNPAFDITKVCDNKKSWVTIDGQDDRQFLLPLRETEYSTNNARLVINTKEVDLNMSIANGIETDVWCYTNDNPCILEPCVPEYNIIITTGTSCSTTPNLTGSTNWTGGTTAFPTINMGVDPFFSGEILRLNWAANGTAGYPASAFTTTQYGDCAFIHKINIQATYTSPTRFNGAWIVGNYDGTVDWFYNKSWSGNTELITRYSDTISGETECNIVMSGISEYNTLQGTDFTNVYWDSATSACTFTQPPLILTGNTLVNGCCCGDISLSGTNITGGTVALPPLSAVTPCERVVGEAGPAGGIVYWINPNDPCEGYEVMSYDQNPQVWQVAPLPQVLYGTSEDFATGENNTNLINAISPAAQECTALSYSGYSDWFLPSIDDLQYIRANTNALPITYDDEAGWWSSSEFSGLAGAVGQNAWLLRDNGTISAPRKDQTYKVRAVRYFNTNPCNGIYSALTASTLVNGIGEEYTDCSWIYKFNTSLTATTFDGYWLAGMPDNTLGVFRHITISGGTGTTIDYSEVTSKYCCEAYNDVVQTYAWDTAKGKYYTEFYWDGNCEQCKVVKCAEPQCVDFNELLTSSVTDITTIKEFNSILTSELINVRCRKISSNYPVLRALYERYMNSTEYCDTLSAQFNYGTMSDFSDLVGNYWVDLIEQVMPSTAIWEANQIYGNTIYDQQKFQYKGYSTFPCIVPQEQLVTGLTIRATGNTDVDLYTLTSDGLCEAYEECADVYYITGDCGSEFLGSVIDSNNPFNVNSN